MNEWLTYGDTAPVPTDLPTLLLALLIAFLSGQVIAWVYMFTHTGLSYSRSFVNSLIIIPITVSLVMMVLDNNIVTAFSLLAVFAIVRFRNILRDTLDTVYVLSLIVVGLATGTQKFTTAITGVSVMSIAFIYLWFTSFGSRKRFDLIINFNWSRAITELSDLELFLKRHSFKILRSTQQSRNDNNITFLSYKLLMRDPDGKDLLVSELGAINGVTDIHAMSLEEESEV
ncbi:MAG TPA: hypothetical protein DCE78_12585 [Bacteroidetes bacterium]|nr:hypothetical protein [Bacteroidota bacterium]